MNDARPYRWSLLALAFALLGVTVVSAQAPGTGIANTKHDFTLWNPTGGDASNTINVGKCTFCHTPHKAQQQALIWNHKLSAVASYSWGAGATTVGGTLLPTISSTWNGATKLCLSCHDGSVAIGDIAWFDKASHQGLAAINTRTMSADFPNSQIATTTGGMGTNHPVAHPFPGAGASTYNTRTSGAAAVLSGWQPNPITSGIRLFNDDGSGNISVASVPGTQTGIECSSCHDPHNGSGVTGAYFLRGNLTGNGVDYICTKCHAK